MVNGEHQNLQIPLQLFQKKSAKAVICGFLFLNFGINGLIQTVNQIQDDTKSSNFCVCV